MSEPPPLPSQRPMLAYGAIDTQFGITCEQRADGGITITIPGSDGRFLAYRLTGSTHPVMGMIVAFVFLGGRLFGRTTPPRAVIELTPHHLSITEPDTRSEVQPWAMVTRTWPLAGVAELRPNRYSKGIYVRVPGKDNFDLLTDLDQRLIDHVGRVLEGTLSRLKAAGENPAVPDDHPHEAGT